MAGENKELDDLKAEMAELKKSNEALVAKNRELLDEKRSTKTGAERQLAEAQDKIADYEAQIAKMGADHKKALDKATADLKAAQDLAGAKSQALSRLIKDEGLTKELLAAGVKNPAHLKAAQAMLRELVQVDEEKGEAFVLVKDAKGAETRKTIAEFAKEWAQSDEGKAFVSVAPSSGGGAQGGSSSGPGTDISKMTPTQVMEYAKQGDAQREAVLAHLNAPRKP